MAQQMLAEKMSLTGGGGFLLPREPAATSAAGLYRLFLESGLHRSSPTNTPTINFQQVEDSQIATMTNHNLDPSDEYHRRLFVTFSNLSFLPAIVIALNWQHFHLVIIYVSTMLCSMVYHWCDSSPLWPSSDDCLLNYDTLQFADFFTAGVSTWATLLSMAIIGHRFRLFCLTTAFITFAVSVHSNRFHMATFAVPLLIAALIVILSWVYRCRRLRVIYPQNEGLIRLSVGVCLTIVAACLYLYFQEGVSYEYVHGVWHMIVQLSACCLLQMPVIDASRTDAEVASQSRKMRFVKIFPTFDPAFWRNFKRRSFWVRQVDDCCGVTDARACSPSRSSSSASEHRQAASPIVVRPANNNNNVNFAPGGGDEHDFNGIDVNNMNETTITTTTTILSPGNSTLPSS